MTTILRPLYSQPVLPALPVKN